MLHGSLDICLDLRLCQECVCFHVENINRISIAVLCLLTIMAVFHYLSNGGVHCVFPAVTSLIHRQSKPACVGDHVR